VIKIENISLMGITSLVLGLSIMAEPASNGLLDIYVLTQGLFYLIFGAMLFIWGEQ
jgi:uncharacterized membrane protein HdeD (DUF308 family)